MDMLQMPVRLVVKAPNQQIEDQMVECALDWTVRKLKAYLSEAYPSKPKAEEQKLIYSGQLLHDHLMLKDFLRQYEAEKVHTVHLVCLPPRDDPRLTSSDHSRSNISNSHTTTASTESHTGSVSPTATQSEGLRHRSGILTTPAATSSVSAGQVPNEQLPYAVPNMVEGQSALDIRANQMLWMQHVYNQYMNVYLQQYHTRLPVSNQSQTNNEVPQPEVVQQPQPIVAIPQPPVNANVAGGGVERQAANIRLNAQGGVIDGNDEDDAVGNWDWLDWFYVLSRATVLFSIVYFYSSFNRFVLVMIFASFMYLFRRRNNQRAANARPRPQAAQPAPQPPQNDQQDEPVENEAEQMQRETREIEELMNRDLDDTTEAQNQRGASLIHIAWTFVITFFQSLLPEQPDPFNVN